MAEVDHFRRMTLLYDFYAPLLTPKQQTILGLYYQEDLSLSEIAEDQGTSRQAVHDIIRRSEKALQSYESRLGLAELFAWQSKELARAYELVKSINQKFDAKMAAEVIGILEKVLSSEAPTDKAESGDEP